MMEIAKLAGFRRMTVLLFAALVFLLGVEHFRSVRILSQYSLDSPARLSYYENQQEQDVDETPLPVPRYENAAVLRLRQSILDRNENNQTQPLSLPQLTDECSCANLRAPWNCCKRTLLPTHKMGFDMALQIRQKFIKFYQLKNKRILRSGFPANQQIASDDQFFTKVATPWPVADRRHVVFIRNIYSAIASGYLYHLEGHECHLRPRTMAPWPWAPVKNLHYFWEYVSPTLQETLEHKNQSLCHYLSNTTMEDGLRVYIDWIFHEYYDAIEAYLEFAQQEANKPNVSMHVEVVCFDDMNSKEHGLAAMQTVAETLFPGKRKYRGWFPGKITYTGGHSTSHDPILREKLRSITLALDDTIFGGRVAAFQDRFKCGDRPQQHEEMSL